MIFRQKKLHLGLFQNRSPETPQGAPAKRLQLRRRLVAFISSHWRPSHPTPSQQAPHREPGRGPLALSTPGSAENYNSRGFRPPPTPRPWRCLEVGGV